MKIVELVTTNPLGLLWLSSTISVSVAEFIRDKKIDFKKLAIFGVSSLIILLFFLGSLAIIDFILAQF